MLVTLDANWCDHIVGTGFRISLPAGIPITNASVAMLFNEVMFCVGG